MDLNVLSTYHHLLSAFGLTFSWTYCVTLSQSGKQKVESRKWKVESGKQKVESRK